MFLFGVQKQKNKKTKKKLKNKKNEKMKNEKISSETKKNEKIKSQKKKKKFPQNKKRATKKEQEKKTKQKGHLPCNKQNVVQIFDHVHFVFERNHPLFLCTSSPAPHRQVSQLSLWTTT